jgi:ABC-type antimicrobial peptide transport system permease subunit
MTWYERLTGKEPRRHQARRSASDSELRSAIAREIDEEIGFHLQMRAEENRRAGMDPESAERDAQRRFGDVARISRASRFQRLAPADPGGRPPWGARLAGLLDALRRDARYTLRGFARSPGLFAAAVVTLAIGLGATTSIYSLANWLLLRPVPGVEAPEQLSDVWVGRYEREQGRFSPSFFSYANYHDVADRLTTVTGLAGYQPMALSVASGQDGATSLAGAAVTASYFDVLGVEARLGRTITVSDDDPANGAEIVVISSRLWTTMFDRDPAVLGKTLRLNGLTFTVVGVAPEGFHGTELGGDLDLWIPGATYAYARHSPDRTRYAGRESGMLYSLVARKAPGVSWQQVDAELDSMEEWLAAEFPEVNDKFREIGFTVFGTFGTWPLRRAHLARSLTLLLGVSALVLLIACANVANLLLMRGLGRQAEVSLRKALGAGRGRLLAQHVTEGAFLWLLGGVLGLAVAYDYFQVLVIPVLRGRTFGPDDIAAPGREGRPVVVLSESLARQLFPGEEAIGRRVEFPVRGREDRQFEVIGVVGDVHFGDLTAPPEPVVYEPAGLDGFFFPSQYLAVKLDGPLDVAAAAREIGARLDAALPVGTVMSMDEALADARAQWTLLAKLMSLLAAFAAVLAAVGLYGVVGFGVKARAREIGIRMALGAESSRVFRMVLRNTLGMTIAGLVFGLGGAVALARVLESRLFGVAPFDLSVWTVAAAGLVLIALLAAWMPARRATRVDPAQTLRSL